jgi:hypothetical protein
MTRPPVEILLELSSAHVIARALHLVAEIGVADHLDGEPRTAEELAADTHLNPDALHRVLRLVETRGIFAADADGRWQHTGTSRWLRSDCPRSVRAFARMMGMPFGWEAFTALGHALRTGEPSVLALDPAGAWAYLAAHADQNAVFQQAMLAKAHDDIAAVLGAYDFSRHHRIADIAGGGGHLISAVLGAYEDLSGVLFELPHVAETVTSTPRLSVVAGDFFTDPLPTCDAYVLMNIVHDWHDEDAVAVLRAVGDAAPPGATVLLVETILPEGPEPHWAKTLDVMMLALTGGRERTSDEYGTLLNTAGMDVVRVIPTVTAFSLIEARVR